jgi:hypothetical protein
MNLMLDSLKVYEDRKVKFTKEKSFLKLDLYNEDEKKSEIILLPKKGSFSSGLIDMSLLDMSKVFQMDLNDYSEKAKELIYGLMQGNCLNLKHKVIMTSEIDYALQHELQHVFDNLIGIDGDLREREYRAYLAGLIYSTDSLSHLMNIPSFIEKTINEQGEEMFKGKYKNNYLALITIMNEFKDFYETDVEVTNEEIKNKSSFLLDKNYVKNTGMTYKKLLDFMIEMYLI